MSNSDLAAMDFKDEEGNSTFSEQARSQMMLVVNSVNPETENEMLDTINKDFGIKDKDVKASQTYDINLQICGKFPTISDGSYVKIALGFPEGYGPQDEGVTFKLYHRKHIQGDEYIIEEVPCVVTQFGIVATVTSFSPYMVMAVDASKASANKTVYATVDGKGGTLTKEDGMIRSLKAGESYTYKFTPNNGYKIYKVTMNGTDVTDKVGTDGKFTVAYNDMLNNNEIVVQYISDAAAQRYQAKEIEIVDPVSVVVSTKGDASLAVPADKLPVNQIKAPANDNAAMVIAICCIVAAVAVAGGIAAVVIVKMKKKKSN